MTIYGSVLPGARTLANWAQRTNITEKAKQRLKVVDWLKSHGSDVSLAARHFGLDRKTIRSWRDKFNQVGMLALNDKSHKPKHLRLPTTSWQIVDETVKIRKEYPAWSKKWKIQAILKRKNMFVSASTVGRILKRKCLIDKKISKKKSKATKNPKQRYPRGFRITCAGDMIQIDTKFVTIQNRMIYQFTAIDVLTKRRVLRFYSSLLSKNGADFLRVCLKEFPFPIKAIQTDNGKEFLKDFDKLCRDLNIPHYFIEARHPKQNSYVENSHGFDEREFYQQGNIYQTIDLMDEALAKWQHIWNYERPHQALGYLTPNEYLNKIQITNLNPKEAIILQT